LNRLGQVIEQLLVYPENMKANLDKLGGLHNSQRVLLALVEKGASREDAYRLVQRNAMKVWRDSSRKEGDFLRNLEGDADVSMLLSKAELGEMFDLGYHFKAVDVIFGRVFGQA
ncbi:MAG TPA: adenylosuccinate lyase, partial [Hyphomonadaceae bacterium]|nr:adenylosuccinate lyase [Hyphomonadaceae bacterium]